MSHRVEGQVVILLDSVVVSQKFESRFQDSTLGILVRYTVKELRRKAGQFGIEDG
jgi:hypothetical protein